MSDASEHIKPVAVEDEFSACPECDYANGFHVSFVKKPGATALTLVLSCPSCAARFDVGKAL